MLKFLPQLWLKVSISRPAYLMSVEVIVNR